MILLSTIGMVDTVGSDEMDNHEDNLGRCVQLAKVNEIFFKFCQDLVKADARKHIMNE